MSKYESKTKIECPHCEVEINVFDMEMWDLFGEGSHEVDCVNCLRIIEVEAVAEFTFISNSDED